VACSLWIGGSGADAPNGEYKSRLAGMFPLLDAAQTQTIKDVI
jgi:hypothetical protein